MPKTIVQLVLKISVLMSSNGQQYANFKMVFDQKLPASKDSFVKKTGTVKEFPKI
jgi:hypothetical protein